MKHRVLQLFVLAFAAIFSVSSVFAETVSESEAKAKAMAFLSNGARKLPAKNGVKRKAPAIQNVELAYTSQKDGKTCFYVFNNGEDGGYVIIGGDKVAKEILAYVPQGHFDYDNISDNFRWWLKQTSDNIILSDNEENVQTENVLSSDEYAYFENKVDVPELITTKWHQGPPYNSVIPSIGMDRNGTEIVPSTGCLPTALAQIMKYWEFPTSGTGSHTNLYNNSFSADFEHTIYDWDNMLDVYDQYNETQSRAVSTLMYHLGIALDARYTERETGVQTSIYNNVDVDDGTKVLAEYFKYDKNLKSLCRGNYSLNEWKNIIYDELTLGRPVFYSAMMPSGAGHAFVCHGYMKESDLFAINWGWGGGDGYFSLDETDNFIARSNYEESSRETITIGIVPSIKRPEYSDLCFNDTFVVDGIAYSIMSVSQRTVAVCASPQSSKVIIPSSVSYKGTHYIVNRINERAFSKDYELEEISLPGSIVSIGAEAFYYCRNLKRLDIQEGVVLVGAYAFAGCSQLTTVVLPQTLRTLSYGVFEDCQRIIKLSIPNSVSYVGRACFQECRNLESITLPSNLGYISNVFYDCEKISEIICPSQVPPTYDGPLNLTYLDNNNFVKNYDRVVLYVPKASFAAYKAAPMWGNFKTILPIEDKEQYNYGEKFSDGNLNYEIIPGGVRVIGFTEHKDYVEDLNVPQMVNYSNSVYDVVTIGYEAFQGNLISNIYLPEGLNDIESRAFRINRKLKQVQFPSSLKGIGSQAFANTGIKKVSLPKNLECMGLYAFNNCDSLIAVEIPKLKSLSQVFHSCPLLQRVYFGDVQFSYYSFNNCTSLEEIVLSDSMLLFKEANMPGLKNMTCFVTAKQESELPTCFMAHYTDADGNIVFASPEYSSPFTENQSDGILHVPTECINTYKNAEAWTSWGTICSIIPLSEINISDDSHNLEIGQTKNIEIIAIPNNATVTHCTWTSSDPTIASVDLDGVVTAHKAGTVTITASSMYYPGVEDSCTVTVTGKVYKQGDINGDDVVNVNDVTALVDVILGKGTKVEGNSDVNGDGQVNVNDVTRLVDIILGK